jgi:23S rRNA pseudouridine1911/1915/1917 synthase
MDLNDKCPYAILYEDESVLAVYKKRNVFSIRTLDKATFSHNLYHYLKLYLAKKKEDIFIVHRLDYETSGIMVFAKSLAMKEKLQGYFETRQVGRYYEAVVKENVPLGEKKDITQYLEEKGSNVFPSDASHGKEAITHILAHNRIQIGTALAIQIETGRHNQIRLAIQAAGYTLLGDKRFAHNEAKRMYLNAYKLVFPSESGLKQTTFETTPLWLN